MLRYIILHILVLLCASSYAQYRPDILGGDFQQLTMEHPTAYDGEVVSTLVRHTPLQGVSRAVLYVHGYNDYFFQSEMAQMFIEHSWQFYAVDLRRYGRSIREWQTPYQVYNIDEYFEDIDAAIAQMRSEGVEQIILMAHSTGGLITPLYCQRNRADLQVDALILNSPFFDMNLGGGFFESIGVPAVSLFGALFKDVVVQPGSEDAGGYGRSVSDKYDGNWAIDTSIKRMESLPITAGWIRAIHVAQCELQEGLDIPCPVLVLYSDSSVWGEYSQEYMGADSVLDVEDIATYAPMMGDDVTQIEVAGGMHDLVLSAPDVRYPLYDTIFEWIDSTLE